MTDIQGFKGTGSWYKGNIHGHTVISDGMLTPEESVKLYQEHGYSFQCFSEHDIFTDWREKFNTEKYIILPAVESSAVLYRAKGTNERYKIHHLHGILGTEKMQEEAKEGTFTHLQYIPPMKYFGTWDGKSVCQAVADNLTAHGCVLTYNHPIWSRVTEEEFIHVEGVSALEIFNFNTVQESNTGYDVTYWDRMLRIGKRINAFASDDNHNEGLFEDSCGGWIMVQAPELTHEAIVQNFLDGNYYSSAGPEIYDWGVKDGTAYIDCSEVNHVNFVAGNIINDGTTVLGKPCKNTVTHAEYRLKGHETYVRVEAVDCYGRTAWTNPIWLSW